MARKHHYRRRSKISLELDVTTFLNLMVALIPFLLITAVFSRVAIVELNLPSLSGGAGTTKPEFRVEVIVREGGLEIGDGTTVFAAIPKKNGDYDLERLSELMVSLKQDYPESDAASVLLEGAIPYDYLIQVMDAVRTVELPADADVQATIAAAGTNTPASYVPHALFTQISVGDAP